VAGRVLTKALALPALRRQTCARLRARRRGCLSLFSQPWPTVRLGVAGRDGVQVFFFLGVLNSLRSRPTVESSMPTWPIRAQRAPSRLPRWFVPAYTRAASRSREERRVGARWCPAWSRLLPRLRADRATLLPRGQADALGLRGEWVERSFSLRGDTRRASLVPMVSSLSVNSLLCARRRAGSPTCSKGPSHRVKSSMESVETALTIRSRGLLTARSPKRGRSQG
jgi:hypothetical protein